MAVSVKISEIIDAIEFNSDFSESYINKKTGKVYYIAEEYFRWAEDEEMSEGLADWEKEEIAISKEILYSEDYIALPDEFEINEYGLMEKFCLSLSDEKLREEMYYSIKGKGAFRRFKNNIYRYGLADEWYKYRDENLMDIAVERCKENGFTILDE